MAKHNDVFLYGQVLLAPKIIMKDGEYERGVCPILVMRGYRSYGETEIKNIGFDKPVIMTGNPIQVEKMAQWKPGDMVEVKGCLTTKDVKKVSYCPHCKTKNAKQGVVSFINPIYTKIIEHNLTKEKGLEKLKESCEISNSAHLIGMLCREPQGYITSKKTMITNYQLAVSRKFHILEDSVENRVDFPWVKAYGSIARDDYKYLKKGSYVLVDGMIQSRDIERQLTCDNCGHEYLYKETVLDIVPYSTEYLRNFRTEEEIASAEAAEREAAIKSVFGEKDVDFATDKPDIPDELYKMMTEE